MHIKGSRGYSDGRSYLDGDLAEAQWLVDELSTTGEAVFDSNANWKIKKGLLVIKLQVLMQIMKMVEKRGLKQRLQFILKLVVIFILERMNDMKLKETFGKKIKILCVDGGSIEGRVIDYIPTIEEDEEECIIIRNENNVLIEIAKHEITEIEIL